MMVGHFAAKCAGVVVLASILIVPWSTRLPGSVDQRRWPDGGAPSLKLLPRPALLSESPAASWRAMHRWTLPYVREAFGRLAGVWVAQQPLLAYFAVRGGVFGIRAAPGTNSAVSSVVETEMSASDFVDSAAQGNLLYCAHDLEELGPAAAADIGSLAPFDVGDVEQPPTAIVWLGSRSVTALAHYDTSYNTFVQVVGRKRIWLWPPAAHRQLQLFPSRHSLHRRSALLASTAASAIATPLSSDAAVNAIHEAAIAAGGAPVDLSPGDVLFIPPYWFHMLQSIDPLSISVSLWSESQSRYAKSKLEQLPLPWEASWSRAWQTTAAAIFILRTAEAAFGGISPALDLLDALRETRYDRALSRLSDEDKEGLLEDPSTPLEYSTTTSFPFLLAIAHQFLAWLPRQVLLVCFADDTFTASSISTIGIDFKIRTLDLDVKRVNGKSGTPLDRSLQMGCARRTSGNAAEYVYVHSKVDVCTHQAAATCDRAVACHVLLKLINNTFAPVVLRQR
ncbi:hypothetical protein AB1Y20_003088 [Prymnesium parvum]|uniref:JmjC domain-containing protein n=1 Tax=Prymnesium parvum TaxID=97485 RepID=A0AB34JBI7_PRYPA